MITTKHLKWILPSLVLVLFILLWEATVNILDIKEYLLPAPSTLISAFLEKMDLLLQDTITTASEAFLGFVLANVLSLIIAVLFCHYQWFENSFYPYMIAIKSVPVIAMAPLLILWFGFGFTGKVVMAAIIAFFPLVVNATIGLKSIDPLAIDLMRSMSATKTQILFLLRFPTALPYIFSALKISSTMAVVGAIIAEMTGPDKGLGSTIIIASMNIDTPLMFVAIVLSALVGIGFFLLIVLIEKMFRSGKQKQKDLTL